MEWENTSVMVERLRGFRDFYPEDQEVRGEKFGIMRNSCLEYGFREIDGPSLENVELFANKSGMEITNQMFSFRDKGGRDVALIPEFTPTLARMVSARKDLVKPLKWFSIEKFWRYEEPQSGRFREFYQLNADILGSESYLADAEITALGARIMKKLEISDKVKIKTSSRMLIDSLLEKYSPGNKDDVYYVLDRWNKMSTEERNAYIEAKGMDRDVLSSFSDGKILDGLEDPELGRLRDIMDYVKSSEAINIEIDLKIVRGIAYYTGYVFEAWDRDEKFRSILGGGRYDEIIKQLGGERTPSVGFAVGDAVLENVLKANGKWKSKRRRQIFLATIDGPGKTYAPKIAAILRGLGLGVDVNITERGISKQLDYASKMGYEFVAIVGENEAKRGTFLIKNLATGNQEEIASGESGEIVEKITNLLS